MTRKTIKQNLINWAKFEANNYNNKCWLFDHNEKKHYFFNQNNVSFQTFYNMKKILPNITLINAYNHDGLILFLKYIKY